MAALTSAQVQQYFIGLIKGLDAGELPLYPDPATPTDAGTALTQEDIDSIKVIRKEITERFNPPVEG